MTGCVSMTLWIPKSLAHTPFLHDSFENLGPGGHLCLPPKTLQKPTPDDDTDLLVAVCVRRRGSTLAALGPARVMDTSVCT